MNLIKMLQRIYQELFSWAFDKDYDLDRTFNDLNAFHDKALPDSENPWEKWYAKIFKSNLFLILSPIVYMFLKFQAMKYTNQEYLNRMIEKSLEDDN